MDGLGADHTWRAPSADKDLLARQMPDVDAADGLETIESVAIIAHDHETHFVHVRVEHHPHAVPAAPVAGDEHVAQRVYPDVICVWFDLFKNNAANLSFVARDRDD